MAVAVSVAFNSFKESLQQKKNQSRMPVTIWFTLNWNHSKRFFHILVFCNNIGHQNPEVNCSCSKPRQWHFRTFCAVLSPNASQKKSCRPLMWRMTSMCYVLKKYKCAFFWLPIKFMTPQPPTVSQWRQKLADVYVMEALTAKSQLRSDIFGRRWRPIARYLSNWRESMFHWTDLSCFTNTLIQLKLCS